MGEKNAVFYDKPHWLPGSSENRIAIDSQIFHGLAAQLKKQCKKNSDWKDC